MPASLKWGTVCIHFQASCCADGRHCCQYGYTCDCTGLKCRKWWYSQSPSGPKEDAKQNWECLFNTICWHYHLFFVCCWFSVIPIKKNNDYDYCGYLLYRNLAETECDKVVQLATFFNGQREFNRNKTCLDLILIVVIVDRVCVFVCK